MVSENYVDAAPSQVDADIAADTTATAGDDGDSIGHRLSYLHRFAVQAIVESFSVQEFADFDRCTPPKKRLTRIERLYATASFARFQAAVQSRGVAIFIDPAQPLEQFVFDAG